MIPLAGVVILNQDGEMLLLHHKKHHHYQFPGGKVEKGESSEGAAVRETREEIGCDVEINRLLVHDSFKANGEQFTQHLFFAKLKKGQIPKIMESEIFDEIIWLKVEEFKSFSDKLAPNVFSICKNFLNRKLDFPL